MPCEAHLPCRRARPTACAGQPARGAVGRLPTEVPPPPAPARGRPRVPSPPPPAGPRLSWFFLPLAVGGQRQVRGGTGAKEKKKGRGGCDHFYPPSDPRERALRPPRPHLFIDFCSSCSDARDDGGAVAVGRGVGQLPSAWCRSSTDQQPLQAAVAPVATCFPRRLPSALVSSAAAPPRPCRASTAGWSVAAPPLLSGLPPGFSCCLPRPLLRLRLAAGGSSAAPLPPATPPSNPSPPVTRHAPPPKRDWGIPPTTRHRRRARRPDGGAPP